MKLNPKPLQKKVKLNSSDLPDTDLVSLSTLSAVPAPEELNTHTHTHTHIHTVCMP